MTKDEKRAYMREYQKKWRQEHAELIREYNRQYYKENREKILQRNNEYKAKDPEKWRKYAREFNREHPEYGKRSYEKFKKTHDWVAYCNESRKRRIAKMKEQGILNPYCVINKLSEPKYKEGFEPNGKKEK